jgi:hypothetical protein
MPALGSDVNRKSRGEEIEERSRSLFDVVEVRRAARRADRLADHHLGAGEVLVIELEEPAAVASDVGGLRRRIPALHDGLVHFVDVERAEGVMVEDAELAASTTRTPTCSIWSETRVGARCFPASRRWTEPLTYWTNWTVWPSGSLTVKLRLPFASFATLAGVCTPFAAR